MIIPLKHKTTILDIKDETPQDMRLADSECPGCHKKGRFSGSFCSNCYSDLGRGFRSYECLKNTYSSK